MPTVFDPNLGTHVWQESSNPLNQRIDALFRASNPRLAAEAKEQYVENRQQAIANAQAEQFGGGYPQQPMYAGIPQTQPVAGYDRFGQNIMGQQPGLQQQQQGTMPQNQQMNMMNMMGGMGGMGGMPFGGMFPPMMPQNMGFGGFPQPTQQGAPAGAGMVLPNTQAQNQTPSQALPPDLVSASAGGTLTTMNGQTPNSINPAGFGGRISPLLTSR